jgi:hypothetical protein
MTRSFYAIPAVLCLTAAVVTAQAPAEDRPAANAPAAQQPAPAQPAAQQPTTPRPTTPPARPAEPSTQTARPSDPASTSAANTLTYTGCIKPGTTAGTWVLENAEAAARPGASAPGTVGTSGTAKSMSLDLDPAATVNLKAHANHKVELMGTLAPVKGAAGATASAPPSSAPGAATAQAARQQFSVQSLKMVSATCP